MNYNEIMSLKNKTESGYLEIIIGPMFSGKTSKLLELYLSLIHI